MTSFSLEMEELLNALLLAHKNILHPVILNNIQLKTILGNMQSELCTNRVLPLTNNTVLPKQCAVHHIFHNNAYFKKLNTKNTFLYWVSTTVQTTLVCSASTTFHILKGAETIKLPSACSLYTPTTILRASEEKRKNINISVNINPDISHRIKFKNKQNKKFKNPSKQSSFSNSKVKKFTLIFTKIR